MTCRGYDSRAVKISKAVKRGASRIMDAHARGAYLRSYVAIARDAALFKGSRRDNKR